MNAIKLARIPKFGSYPLGFRTGTAHCGIKKNPGVPDLAVIVSDRDCSAAGVFTTNIFKAAPVTADQNVLATGKGKGVRSVIINSGCANAVTGKQGYMDAQAMIVAAAKAANAAEHAIGALCMSTGVIGQKLPIEKVLTAIPSLTKSATRSHEAWLDCARGIMTTDTFPKLASTTFANGQYRIVGISKGAGMIHPNMATLLGCLATDAPVSPDALQKALKAAVDVSFNSISIDGDMSTNDTILALANGAAGGNEIGPDGPLYDEFQQALSSLSVDLAKLVVRDGEGATKFVTVKVLEAKTKDDARRIASSISTSALVKTALYGKDANWGRIACAIGYSKVKLDPSRVSISFVPTDGSAELKLLANGEPEMVDEVRASKILELPDLEINVRLGMGDAEAVYYTCDFSHEYVTINGDYRS